MAVGPVSPGVMAALAAARLAALATLAVAALGSSSGPSRSEGPHGSVVEGHSKEAAWAEGAPGGNGEADMPQLKAGLLLEELGREQERLQVVLAHVNETNATLKAQEREIKSTRAKLEKVLLTTDKLRAELVNATARTRELEGQDAAQVGTVGTWITELPHQELISLILGVMGLVVLIGPTDITRPVVEILGSAVGGLLAASSFMFFKSAGTSLLDSICKLAGGEGTTEGYAIWLAMFLIGVLRWLAGFNFGLWACVDEVRLDAAGRVNTASLQKPLLAGGS